MSSIPGQGMKISCCMTRKKEGSLMNERFQRMLGTWKEDASSYEGNRWKQQLRTFSQPAKSEVGAS